MRGLERVADLERVAAGFGRRLLLGLVFAAYSAFRNGVPAVTWAGITFMVVGRSR
jgi:hypothetical protein